MISYRQLYNTLQASGELTLTRKAAHTIDRQLTVLLLGGFINARFISEGGEPYINLITLKEAEPTPQPAVIAPNPPQIATPASVQVQWWQKGARQGLFSQQTYDVLSQDDKWTTIALMGKPHVVANSRVRVAA